MQQSLAPATPIRPEATLPHVCRSAVSVMAVTAYRSGVDAEGIRDLFASASRTPYGLSPDFEAAVLAELAALS
jgi:hypothetical protein